MTSHTRATSRKVAASEIAVQLGPWTDSKGPLYGLLAAGIDGLIAEGVLRHGDRLPAERALAAQLNVSRGTVVSAYEQLRGKGRVERVQGSGTAVATHPQGGAPATGGIDRIGDPLFRAPRTSIDLLLATPPALSEVLDLAQNLDFGRYRSFLNSTEPAGIPPLRAAIADLMTSDGLPTTPEQIVVTNGAQQAVSLVCSVVVSPGDVVLTEQTTWPGLADSARTRGATVHGVGMDAHGVIAGDLEAAIERFRPALVALNPHHHNPTGTCMSPTRRADVARIASDFGVPLLEDRVAARLSFGPAVPRPLAAEAPAGFHFVADSVNKVAWTGARIGWVRADVNTIQDLRSTKAMADLYSSIPTQLLALAILEDFDDIVARRREQLRGQYATLTREIERRLPDWQLTPRSGGLVDWIRLPRGTATGFAQHAAGFGVAVTGGREFAASTLVDDHLRLPFTSSEELLVEAIERLGRAWETYDDALVAEPIGHARMI